MIYLFTGTDEYKSREKALQWIALAKEKAPSVLYMKIDADALTASLLDEVCFAEGLFYSKMLVFLDTPLATEQGRELIERYSKQLAAASNVVEVLASKILVANKDLKELATKVFTFEAKETASRGFNSALVNALGTKNRTALWREIVLAARAGEAPEAIHGLLHWKARDMMVKGSPAYDVRTARSLSLQLLELLSRSRKGDNDLQQNLELFALSI